MPYSQIDLGGIWIGNYPFGMFAVPREHVARVHASSGRPGSLWRSAGKAKRVVDRRRA